MPNNLDIVESVISDVKFQAQLRGALRDATIGLLKTKGIELTPEEWGELTARSLSSRSKSAEDVMAGAAAVVIGFSLSDARLKVDIVPTGLQERGFNIYEFSYRGFSSRWRGVIAQEVKFHRPDAVFLLDNGYLAVDYDAIGVKLTGN